MAIDKRKLIEPIASLIKLPPEMIDQRVKQYVPNKPCSFGAHLANMLFVANGTKRDYLKGVDAWMESVGGNRAHAIVMLQQAGTGTHPFCSAPWWAPLPSVCKKLDEIDELPSLKGATLWKQNLIGVNMEGMDLSYADLSHSLLNFANLDKANLESANLSGVEAHHGSFVGANMRKAKMTFVRFKEADLQKADLTSANLYNGYFLSANMRKTNLTNASLKQAVFYLADLMDVVIKDTNLFDAVFSPKFEMKIRRN